MASLDGLSPKASNAASTWSTGLDVGYYYDNTINMSLIAFFLSLFIVL